jgi:ureidoglycolate lyase
MKQAKALTSGDFTPFGEVLSVNDLMQNVASNITQANQGSALRVNQATSCLNLRPDTAKANISMFRCQPRSMPFEIKMLEKHPFSTQIFVPMNHAVYLVVVALGDDTPDLNTLQVFRAENLQGISYKPSTWHHPMIVVSPSTDFTCFVYEDASPGDCVEYHFEEKEKLFVCA